MAGSQLAALERGGTVECQLRLARQSRRFSAPVPAAHTRRIDHVAVVPAGAGLTGLFSGLFGGPDGFAKARLHRLHRACGWARGHWRRRVRRQRRLVPGQAISRSVWGGGRPVYNRGGRPVYNGAAAAAVYLGRVDRCTAPFDVLGPPLPLQDLFLLRGSACSSREEYG